MTKDKYNSSTAVYETSAQVTFSGDIAFPESTPAGPLSPLFQGTTLRYTGSVRLRLYDELSLIYEDRELYYEDADSSLYAFEVTVPSYEPEVLCAAYGAFPGQCTFFAHTSAITVCASKHTQQTRTPYEPAYVVGLVARLAVSCATLPSYAVSVSLSATYTPYGERPSIVDALDAYGANLGFSAESSPLVKGGVSVDLTWGSAEKIVVGSIRHIADPVQVAYRVGTLYRLSMYRSNPELRYPGDSLTDFGYIREVSYPAMALLNKDSLPLKLAPVIVGGVATTADDPLLGVYSSTLAACIQNITLAELAPFISADSVPVIVADYFSSADSGCIPAQVRGPFEVSCLTASSHLFDISQRCLWAPIELGLPEYADGEPLISSLICDTFAFDISGESVDISLHGLLELQAVRAWVDSTKAYVHTPAHVRAPEEVVALTAVPSSLYSVSAFTGTECRVDATFANIPTDVGTITVHCADTLEHISLAQPEHFFVGAAVLSSAEHVVCLLEGHLTSSTIVQLLVDSGEFALCQGLVVGTPIRVDIDFFYESRWNTANTTFVFEPYLDIAEWSLGSLAPHLLAHTPEYIEYACEAISPHVTCTYVYEPADLQLAHVGDAFGMTVISAHQPQYVSFAPGEVIMSYIHDASGWEPNVEVATYAWMQECTFYGDKLRVDNTDPFINGYVIPRPPALVASYAHDMGDSASLYRYGITYRGIGLLYRVGSGMREWATGGIAYAVDVRVADLQCTLGITNKALIISVGFHDILQDQHKRSGLGDEGSKGRRSVMYRAELVGSGLLYRGAGPVYVSDIVFDQDKMNTAFLTFECQTPWDIYELNAVDYSEAGWLYTGGISHSAIGYGVSVDVSSGNIENTRSPYVVLPLNLPISLEPATVIPAFDVVAAVVARQYPEWEHALVPAEVTIDFPNASMQCAMELDATVYFPEYEAFHFTDEDITRTVHAVYVEHPTYSISQSFEFFADKAAADIVYTQLIVPISPYTVYAPVMTTALLTGMMDTVFDGAALYADTVAWELSVDDISRYPHEVCPVIAGISGEHAFSFWIERPLYAEFARYSSWAATPTANNAAVHSVNPIAAYLSSTQVVDSPALQVEVNYVTEPRSAGDMLTASPCLNAVECVIADLELSVIPAEYAFTLQAHFTVSDTLVAPTYIWAAATAHVALANLIGGANLGELPAYEVAVDTSESETLIVPAVRCAVATEKIAALMASVDTGVPVTDIPAFQAVIECTGWGNTEYSDNGEYRSHDVSLLFGTKAMCATSVIAHKAFLLDVDTVPDVSLAPRLTGTVHEVRAEYLCLLECKVCRPLPHTEVQPATLAYAPIILEYDYENTDPSEYAFIM